MGIRESFDEHYHSEVNKSVPYYNAPPVVQPTYYYNKFKGMFGKTLQFLHLKNKDTNIDNNNKKL
jgi:hypothetical protein